MKKYSWLSGYCQGLSVGALAAGIDTSNGPNLFWIGLGVVLFFMSYRIPSDPVFPPQS